MRTPTPRHLRASSSRGIGTLIGNGWLRESARNNLANAKWDVRGRSALRKCMFLAIPDEVRALADRLPNVSPAALPPRPAPRREEREIVPHRRDPAKDARELPAYPAGRIDHYAAGRLLPAARPSPKGAPPAPLAPVTRAWWEDPVALGSLLILLPPVGLAAVWMSKRYSNDARWALTVMTALTMCLMSAIVIAALVMR